MSRFVFSQRSLNSLEGVHEDLVKVAHLALHLTDIDFIVLEGLRTPERQLELVRNGASQTLNSRHLTGHAIDIAPWVNGEPSWHWPHYYRLEPWIKLAAKQEGVPIRWGGDWKSFKDGPHWELPRDVYPA